MVGMAVLNRKLPKTDSPDRGPSALEPAAPVETQRLFPITSHTLIREIQSGDQKSREVSLARFCSLYYPAIYGFARLRGLTVEDAQDRTQDFFVEVVRDDLLSKFDLSHGSKLSSWLMKCFKHMELNHRTARSAVKRGGGWEFVSFDTDFAEQNFQSIKLANLAEASSTDIMLARTLWREAKAQLYNRHRGTPNERLVQELIPFVLAERWPEPPAPSQQQLAEEYGTTAVRLKAFFNRTLKGQAFRLFSDCACSANAGISEQEIDELWALLRAHANV